MVPAFEALFGPAGFAVQGVASGEEALALVRQRTPAALVTEFVLPGMDGVTLLRQVRRDRPSMPAVICTDTPSAAAIVQAIRAGADDVCVKHRDSATHLRNTLRRAMRRRAHQVESERLLREISTLNDRFLETMVELERENSALMSRMAGEPLAEPGFRVLVVDDDIAIVAVLEAVLRSQSGIDVTGVTSGREAREALEAGSFDLVLTDVQLGDDDGVALAAWIHEHRPATAVALMTGFATLDSAVAAIREGVVGYLQKPFHDLDEVLGKVLEVRDALEAERRKHAWFRAYQSKNADFLARYRLLKNKLKTLERESS
jgi:DNA-binding NtrC family response regulator